MVVGSFLSRSEFTKWLHTHPMDMQLAHGCEHCPLARAMIAKYDYPRMRIGRVSWQVIYEYTDEQITWSDCYKIPVWASRFISRYDRGGTQTVANALQILAQIPEDVQEEG